jgi:hypothetical protein
LPRKVRGAAVAVAAAEAPALASVPAVAALVECQEVGARELADLVLVAGRAQRVNQEAFGKVAAVVRAAEEVWEPAVPQVVEQGKVLAAGGAAAALVRVADQVLAAVDLGLALAAGRGPAVEALAPLVELAAGKPLAGG